MHRPRVLLAATTGAVVLRGACGSGGSKAAPTTNAQSTVHLEEIELDTVIPA